MKDQTIDKSNNGIRDTDQTKEESIVINNNGKIKK